MPTRNGYPVVYCLAEHPDLDTPRHVLSTLDTACDPAPMDDTVSKAEAALMMGVSTRTVDRWFPPGHPARSMTRAKPGTPAEVRISRPVVLNVIKAGTVTEDA